MPNAEKPQDDLGEHWYATPFDDDKLKEECGIFGVSTVDKRQAGSSAMTRRPGFNRPAALAMCATILPPIR